MKNLYISFLILVFCCFGCISSYGQTSRHHQPDASDSCVVLRFTQSSNLNTYHPTNTNPASQELDAIAWTVSGTPTTWRSFLDFNFDTIPAGAIIDSAILSLYGDSATAEPEGDSALSGSNSWVIERIISAWSGSIVTWSTQPDYTPVDSVQMPQSTSIYEDFPDINVTQLVQDIVNNLPTEYGLMLKLNTEVYYRSMVFCSNYFPNTARRPSLKVCYRSDAGINTIIHGSGLSVYPNPSSDFLTFTYSTIDNMPVTYRIYNILGVLVATDVLSESGTHLSQTISIVSLPPGIYLLQLNEGKNILSTTFIKE